MKNRILILGLSTIILSSCNEEPKQKQADEAKPEIAENITPEKAREENDELTITKVPNVTNGAEAYFSPDGKSLIYNGKEEGDESHMVYTINIDGSNRKRINDKGEDACSYYAPDGKSLIWTSTRANPDMHKGNYSDPKDYPQGAEIFTSDLDGENVKRLTNNKYYDAEVAYSPDGKKILFGRQIDGKMDLWTMDIDGSNQTQITFTEDWQEGGAFIMPDNKSIIYRAWKKSEEENKSKDMQIFTIGVDGSNMKQITTEAGTHWAPFPAPDGEHFAYVKVYPPHNYELVLRSLKTGEERRLTNNKSFDGFPSISKDGKLLSFSSSRGNEKGDRSLKPHIMDISSLNIGAKN